MKKLKPNKYRIIRDVTVVAGVVINFVLAALVYALKLPLYLDTIGTIGVAALGGSFPGIVTAIATNFLCASFNKVSVYFAILNALIAILASFFAGRGYFKKVGTVITFILGAALIGGGLGAVVQLMLFGGPQIDAISVTVNSICEPTGLNKVFCFIVINTGLNIVDKSITTLLALLGTKFFKEDVKKGFRQSGWKQNPLSGAELRELRKRKTGRTHSLRIKMSVMIAVSVILLTLVMIVISVRLYNNNFEEEQKSNADSIASKVAEAIDGNRIDDYLKNGAEEEGYTELLNTIRFVAESVPGLDYISIFTVRDGRSYNIMESDPEFIPESDIGYCGEASASFTEMLNKIAAGDTDGEVIFKNGKEQYLVFYKEIRDSLGNVTAFVEIELTMDYVSGFVGDYLFKVALIFAVFFLAMLAYGFRVSGMHLVYPINSMAACTEDFAREDTEQGTLEDHVKKVKRLDIHTGDEIESLYNAICHLTEDTAWQIREIRHYTRSVTQMQRGLIITMADLVENRDSDTGAHVQKTAEYVRIIMEGLKKRGYYTDKLTPKYMSDVEMSAPLHDIGKINISDTILNKNGKLTPEEFEIMKTHTTAGRNIMEKAISTVQGESYLKEARNMAAYHHEKWDGSGYPDGLSGEVIPLSARIMAVADVFDALVSKRVYKDPMPFDKALDIIQKDSGVHFDPKCVEAFMDSLDEVKRVMKKYEGM